MKKYISEKGTIFFGVGLVTLLVSIISCVILNNSNDMDNRVAAVYIGIGIVPISIFILLDRLFVWKFGQKEVNKVELYIIGVLFILNFIRFLIYMFLEIIS